LEIPDFSKERLALSGIALKTTPPTASGPPGALSKILPVVPTTLRQFLKSDHIGGFVRISQGGTQPVEPVTVGLQLMDDKGANAAQNSVVLDAARSFVGRMTDYEFELPLANLGSGQYLLKVSASVANRTSVREVRFTVLR
jgi:hypothetical protein